MKFVRLTTPFFFCISALMAQTANPVIHVDVDLRQVDLVVTDSKGHHIADLKPEEFQIFEDGRQQKITNFSWIEVTPPPTGARLAAIQKPVSFWEKLSGVASIAKTPGNDIVSAPVANPHKDEVRRTIAFVMNDHSVSVMDRVRKLIDEQIAPGDMVSIRSPFRSVIPMPKGMETIRDSMGIFQQFTNDKRQLDAALYRVPRTCDFIHTCITDVPGAVRSAIQSLREVPGRKALVFVGGYRGPVDAMVDLANRAGVVVYVLNPAGFPLDAMKEGFPVEESVVQLAKKTGGVWLLATPGADLTTDLNGVLEDLSGYYLLGYHPEKNDGDVRHRIEVKVLRAGLIVRARNGEMGSPATPANAAVRPQGREEVMTQALFSIFTADGIRVHLDPTFDASPVDAKTKKHPLTVRTKLNIEGRDLTLADGEGTGKKVVLDMALALFNEDGTQAGAKNMTFTIGVPREKAAGFVAMGVQYTMEVPVANPGPYQVRAAVRDQASGEIGSAYAFLNIPDVDRQRISLSSLQLSLPDGSADEAAAGFHVAAGHGSDLSLSDGSGGETARPSWGEFMAGTTLGFRCEAFGLKTGGNVDLEVRLYRGGGPVVDIPPTAARIENINGRLYLGGSLNIPGDLAAGNYAMEVVAYDGLEAQKKQAAEQWVDLTLVAP